MVLLLTHIQMFVRKNEVFADVQSLTLVSFSYFSFHLLSFTCCSCLFTNVSLLFYHSSFPNSYLPRPTHLVSLPSSFSFSSSQSAPFFLASSAFLSPNNLAPSSVFLPPPPWALLLLLLFLSVFLLRFSQLLYILPCSLTWSPHKLSPASPPLPCHRSYSFSLFYQPFISVF